mmetsp:Transcript_31040/g.103377  ORF Transcript_31040/g.103377 Transcript_31040/m.103377 type:complete len:353 (+) Transcript_31040:143-1201(+)
MPLILLSRCAGCCCLAHHRRPLFLIYLGLGTCLAVLSHNTFGVLRLAILFSIFFPCLLRPFFLPFSATLLITVLIDELMQKTAIFAITRLAFQELSAIPRRAKACPQDVTVHVETIDSLDGDVCVLGVFKGQVRTEERRCVVGSVVPRQLRLHRHIAHNHARELAVLSKKLSSPQHLRLSDVRSQTEDMHNVPLQDTHLVEIPSATSALPLLQLLCMPSTQVAFLLLAGLIVYSWVCNLVFLFFIGLPFVCYSFTEVLCLPSIISEAGFSIVLSACGALTVHLFHDVVDAEQTDLVIAWASEERVVRFVQRLHAQWAAILLIILHDELQRPSLPTTKYSTHLSSALTRHSYR